MLYNEKIQSSYLIALEVRSQQTLKFLVLRHYYMKVRLKYIPETKILIFCSQSSIQIQVNFF